MTARDCFTGKIAAGMVARDAGGKLLDMIEVFQRKHEKVLGGPEAAMRAAEDAAIEAKGEAAIKADQTRRQIIVQANTLDRIKAVEDLVKEKRNTPGDFGFGNKAPFGLGKDQTTLGVAVRAMLAPNLSELESGSNVFALAKFHRGRAQAILAETLESLRPKNLGFKPETANGLDLLRAMDGRSDVPDASSWAQATSRSYKYLADEYRRVGGQLGEIKKYGIGNPDIREAAVRAAGAERYKEDLRQMLDREETIDYVTNKPMTDVRFERFLTELAENVIAGENAVLSGKAKGQRMLANARDYHRVLHFKDADSWMSFAEKYGEHADVFHTIFSHVQSMSNDIAMMDLLSPNPQAWKRFVDDAFDREPARLAVEAPADATPKQRASYEKKNLKIENQVARSRQAFDNMFAEITNQNKIPVDMAMAQWMGDARHLLGGVDLGGAIISSFNDPGMAVMRARMDGIPAANVLKNATSMMGEKGSEIFVAQQGLLSDTLAHAVGQVDRLSGEMIRAGLPGKIATANIRLSGLRRWTAILRGSFGLEWMAHIARERGQGFADLDPKNIDAFARYGIGENEWNVIRSIEPHEPRPNAIFTRPLDLFDAGHRDVAEKLNRLITTEMDFAVIENSPQARSIMLGQSRPGTLGGETRRSLGMYQSFVVTYMIQQFGTAFARGWDGSRLSHAALTFITMTMLGALSMQAKAILGGQDPISLNPTERHGVLGWGKAIVQGGGLGKFGDMLAVDQTKYGNSWASYLAGPIASRTESILGDFFWKNVQAASKGQETHLLGDAAYAFGNNIPGSRLWFLKTEFQRQVLDQLALMADSRAPERFRRMEETARKDWGQSYWWKPGRTSPSRAPNLEAALGGR